jgi:hypothetical protein
MKCRHCEAVLNNILVDLGFAPPSNAYLSQKQLSYPETTFPLKIYVCDSCWLVQTIDYADADKLFSHDYAYFSSVSKSWLKHAEDYSHKIIEKLNLTSNSFVIEIASNDGYLLKNFVNVDIPCLGIEPTIGTALEAERLGIPVLKDFFTEELALELASKGKKADLIIGNNVFAHVPNINDFTLGIKAILHDRGVVTLEFPHLLKLLQYTQFDTIYHEHFSYLSLITVKSIFEKSGLKIFDVEEIKTHGGSLRVYGCHQDADLKISSNVAKLIDQEINYGLTDLKIYKNFQIRVNKVKNDFVSFLIEQYEAGKKVAGYGAAAKGNTLMNYSGVRQDLIQFIADAAPSKQNKFAPGSHIPILHPDAIKEHMPDIIIIFPWNLSPEITTQLEFIKSWGGQFITFIPDLQEI